MFVRRFAKIVPYKSFLNDCDLFQYECEYVVHCPKFQGNIQFYCERERCKVKSLRTKEELLMHER